MDKPGSTLRIRINRPGRRRRISMIVSHILPGRWFCGQKNMPTRKRAEPSNG